MQVESFNEKRWALMEQRILATDLLALFHETNTERITIDFLSIIHKPTDWILRPVPDRLNAGLIDVILPRR